jgi:ACT domain-containing protein
MPKEELARLVPRIAALVVNHTGDRLSEKTQEDLVLALTALYLEFIGGATEISKDRIIVSAIGKNNPGIEAAISEGLARHGADIIDINQTLVQDNFAMIMVVDLGVKRNLGALKQDLQAAAKELGIQVFAQHEEIFRSMQRI